MKFPLWPLAFIVAATLLCFAIGNADGQNFAAVAATNYLVGVSDYGRTLPVGATSDGKVISCPPNYLPAGLECFGLDCSRVALVCRRYTLFGDAESGLVRMTLNASRTDPFYMSKTGFTALAGDRDSILSVSNADADRQNASCAEVGPIGALICLESGCSEMFIACSPLETVEPIPGNKVSVSVGTSFAPNECILTDVVGPENDTEAKSGVYGVCPGPSQVLSGLSKQKNGYRLLCCASWYTISSEQSGGASKLEKGTPEADTPLFPPNTVFGLEEPSNFRSLGSVSVTNQVGVTVAFRNLSQSESPQLEGGNITAGTDC